MSNQNVAKFYNTLYTNDPTAFKRAPLPLVTAVLQYKDSGTVLDVGAAQGDNSIFLAEHGFKVEAWDISEKAVELLQQNAGTTGVKIQTKIADITTTQLQRDFDIIICTFTLHHLTESDALDSIKKIQDHTLANGLNVITTFTKDGDLFSHNPEKGRFYLDSKEQLESLYKEWTIVKLFEKDSPVRATGPGGSPQHNVFVGMIAQKK